MNIKNNNHDARWLLAGIVLCYFALLALVGQFMDYTAFWKYLGVPTLSPRFADLRAITHGWECYRIGYDVLVDNPCTGSAVNYPLLWMQPAFLGLDEEITDSVGVILGMLFFLCVFLMLPRLSRREAMVHAAVLCSPSVMLAVERGNNDLVMFVLCVLAIIFMSKGRPSALAMSVVSLIAAAFLKLYPIAGGIIFLHQSRPRALAAAGMVLVAFGAYVAFTYHDILAIREAVPKIPNWSYGGMAFAQQLAQTAARVGVDVSPGTIDAMYIGALIGACVVALLLARLLRVSKPDLPESTDKAFLGLQLGAAVFALTYALGNNFDYRLIFLILTLPQIMSWSRDTGAHARLSGAMAVCIVATMWLGFFVPGLYLTTLKVGINLNLDEILNWFILVYMLYAMISTLPSWIRNPQS